MCDYELFIYRVLWKVHGSNAWRTDSFHTENSAILKAKYYLNLGFEVRLQKVENAVGWAE